MNGGRWQWHLWDATIHTAKIPYWARFWGQFISDWTIQHLRSIRQSDRLYLSGKSCLTRSVVSRFRCFFRIFETLLTIKTDEQVLPAALINLLFFYTVVESLSELLMINEKLGRIAKYLGQSWRISKESCSRCVRISSNRLQCSSFPICMNFFTGVSKKLAHKEFRESLMKMSKSRDRYRRISMEFQ